ncbi:MAG: 16S rRNA processing protein RimM [Ignavibacteria bacterium]|nr:16S rRNA processing protein RimM [Ignavibacteria bacterium]
MGVNLYAVGKIVGCFGIEGFLKVQPQTHSRERLQALRHVFLGMTADAAVRCDVEEVRVQRRNVLMKLVGIDDRTSAGKIVGHHLFVDQSEISRPAEGSYFIDDIMECEVWSTEGQLIGNVEDVLKMPGQDVWAVRNGAKLHLIPAVKEFVKEVDTKNRRILVQLIEGLIEE